MKTIFAIAAAVGLLSFTAAANAADMPARMPTKAAPMMAPVYNWTGIYIGINGGGGWGRTSQTDTTGATSGNYNQSGGVGGGTLGYNYQLNNIVLGVEGDWDWANINGSSSAVGCTPTCYTNLRWLATARGRLGVAWGMWLPYITGGAAFGSVNTGQTGLPQFAVTATRSGWTLGGGVEAMFAPKWSAKLEYLYADLGTTTYTVAIPVNVPERVNVLRAGINYHF
jgi:outer membrane immunogenic protein